jgi:hypothetical protein
MISPDRNSPSKRALSRRRRLGRGVAIFITTDAGADSLGLVNFKIGLIESVHRDRWLCLTGRVLVLERGGRSSGGHGPIGPALIALALPIVIIRDWLDGDDESVRLASRQRCKSCCAPSATPICLRAIKRRGRNLMCRDLPVLPPDCRC